MEVKPALCMLSGCMKNRRYLYPAWVSIDMAFYNWNGFWLPKELEVLSSRILISFYIFIACGFGSWQRLYLCVSDGNAAQRICDLCISKCDRFQFPIKFALSWAVDSQNGILKLCNYIYIFSKFESRIFLFIDALLLRGPSANTLTFLQLKHFKC